jgi:2-C-methyl-D-erythritol 4-phosphate cytidylyltransferase
MRVAAIIVAAGVGSRMGGPVNKHLLLIRGRPVLAYTLDAFERCSIIDTIILVGGEDRLDSYQALARDHHITKVGAIVSGGQTRQDSCAIGLAQVGDADIVVVHDGARPLVSERVIVESVQAAALHGAAVVAVPVKDTIKTGTSDGFVGETLPRERLWQIQTPQTFRTDLLRHAYQAAQGVFLGTDDASLVERLDLPVKIVQGDYSNIKITTVDDLAVAESLTRQYSGVQM